jgi:hypothetical protein
VSLVHFVEGGGRWPRWAGAALMDAESARPRRERMVVCIFGEGRGG